MSYCDKTFFQWEHEENVGLHEGCPAEPVKLRSSVWCQCRCQVQVNKSRAGANDMKFIFPPQWCYSIMYYLPVFQSAGMFLISHTDIRLDCQGVSNEEKFSIIDTRLREQRKVTETPGRILRSRSSSRFVQTFYVANYKTSYYYYWGTASLVTITFQ